MCLAIFKEANKKVYKQQMQNAFDNNDDGAGFAYPSKGKVIIEKGFFRFEDFWKALKPHMDKPMAIHFRWSTHGLVDETNCHPFRITDDLAMIHNGVISGIDITDKDKSDTRTFVDDYVKPINKGNPMFIYSEYGKRTLKACIGSSKLVFINKKGNRVIVNEKAGHWTDGVWYSNDSYKQVKVRYSSFTTPYYGRTYGSSCYSSGSCATEGDVLGTTSAKPKKKKKSKKKQTWLPRSERKALQQELQQELELSNSTKGTHGVDSTPKSEQMLKPNTDPIEDANGVFCPLVGDEFDSTK
tara:strand:- start:2054 stop:2947 length:894 start_codon:yes stop_codon:yes gene_type:complete